jgi:Transposase DNA-binding/Transposase Tn5 dimerisation domain
MHQITVKDFPELDLGDIRRNDRFVSIINNISQQPGSSIPKQTESWYDTKATYSFFKNEAISLKSLQQAIASYGSTQLSDHGRVLIAHDMSIISYNDLSVDGLGYITEGKGIMCYSGMAISDAGTPLSLLYQHTWVRPPEQKGKARRRKETLFENKESYNWYMGITSVNEQLGADIQKIHIADREADIYELFFCAYESNTDLLVRACRNRYVNDRSDLWDTIAALPSSGTEQLEIPDKTGKKKTCIAVEIRYKKVEILRPLASRNKYESIEMTAIEVKQAGAKEDWQEETIHWKLLTTLTVDSVSVCLQCVRWYCYRWLIERFHYVLKSGTKLEELKLKKAGSLQKAIHVYSIAAMRILQLVYQSRHAPHVSCELALSKQQWSALYILIHRSAALPDKPPTLQQAVNWIGKLGGHLGRKSDGPPGLKTVWLGYQRVCDAANIYQIMYLQNLGKE